MPDKPDTSEPHGIKWERVNPISTQSGASRWRISFASGQSPKWGRFKEIVGAVVWYCGILGAFVIGATILVIINQVERPHLFNLLRRSLLAFAVSQGGNVFGFVSSNIVAPMLLLVFFIILLRQSHGEEAMKMHWRREGIIGSKALVLLIVLYYFPMFLWKGVVTTVYEDHQALVAEKTRLAKENEQLRKYNETLNKNQYVPFVEPKNSLRRRTMRLVGELTVFWNHRPAPVQQRIQDPTTDEERKRNAAFDKYWQDTEAAYVNANYRERLLGIVREYKARGVETTWLEQVIDQPGRQFGSAPFGGTALDNCMRYMTDFCQFRELAYHMDEHDQPIILVANPKE